MADTKSEIDRHRAAAQHEVDDLSRQKESISTHLAQISQLLGTQMPGLSDALKAPQQTRHAVAAPAPKAVAAPAPAPAPAREEPRPSVPQQQAPPGGQAPAGAQKQPVSAKAAKANDEEWWTE
jgi:hypothetical protein